MAIIELQPRKRYFTPNVIANMKILDGKKKISIRIKDKIIHSLGLSVGDKLSIAYDEDNPSTLLLKGSKKGHKISKSYRIFITYPLPFENEFKNKEIPFEIKEKTIYLFFDQIEDKSEVEEVDEVELLQIHETYRV